MYEKYGRIHKDWNFNNMHDTSMMHYSWDQSLSCIIYTFLVMHAFLRGLNFVAKIFIKLELGVWMYLLGTFK